jgi:hypothetical protein
MAEAQERIASLQLGFSSRNATSHASAPSGSRGWIIIGQFKVHFRPVVERGRKDDGKVAKVAVIVAGANVPARDEKGRSREKRDNRITHLRLARSRSISILREELPLCRGNTILNAQSGVDRSREERRKELAVVIHGPSVGRALAPSRPRQWRLSHPPFTVHPSSWPSSRTLATSRLNRARFRERQRAIDHGTEIDGRIEERPALTIIVIVIRFPIAVRRSFRFRF